VLRTVLVISDPKGVGINSVFSENGPEGAFQRADERAQETGLGHNAQCPLSPKGCVV
jgi:hypothetical protein